MGSDSTELGPPTNEFIVYTRDDGSPDIQVRLFEETVWLSQRLLADLYGVSVPTINEHLSNIFDDGEVEPSATIRKFRIVRNEGNRSVSRLVDHYSLPVILAVGYRVRSPAGRHFRRWATRRLEEFVVKGFVLDDERLSEGRGTGGDYFDELLERIRAIRASERRFYQKITDIYARCSVDYDANAEVTQQFYATVQNKMHWAIHGMTAAEVIVDRADAQLPHMGMTTWKNAPAGPIRKRDAGVAKNYLSEDEISELNRVVTMYLDFAEDQARRRITMTMDAWVKKLDDFLRFNERNVLEHAGRVTAELAKEHASEQFERFQKRERSLEKSAPSSDFDRVVDEAKRLAAKNKNQDDGGDNG